MKKLLVVAITFIFCLMISITSFAANTAVELEWNASVSTDVIGYNVYRSDTSGSGYEKINKELITDTEYTDIFSEELETKFYYVVTATDGPNESDFSEEVYVRIDNVPPPAVSGVTIKTITIGINNDDDDIMNGQYNPGANNNNNNNE